MDDIRNILDRYWKRSPGDQSRVKHIPRYLEEVSRSWMPPQTVTLLQKTDLPTRNLDSSSEASGDEGRICPVVPLQSLQTFHRKVKQTTNTLINNFFCVSVGRVKDNQDPGVDASHLGRSEFEGFAVVMGGVGRTCLLDDLCAEIWRVFRNPTSPQVESSR